MTYASSGTKDMIRRSIGIDTSVLVRLVTGQPPDAYSYCVARLSDLAAGGAEILASNQVIGEAFMAVRHYYGVPAQDAQVELLNTLRSGLVAPLNGQSVIDALLSTGRPGLFDRLIADDYSRVGLEVLTLDRKMASLPGARAL